MLRPSTPEEAIERAEEAVERLERRSEFLKWAFWFWLVIAAALLFAAAVDFSPTPTGPVTIPTTYGAPVGTPK